jgi:hypothetical protein
LGTSEIVTRAYRVLTRIVLGGFASAADPIVFWVLLL